MSAADVYSRLALDQCPRLLSNLDLNRFSPTFGCLHRDYWLDKTSDFPDAVRQFGVHALALIYKHPFPGSAYHRHPKILAAAAAALDFWAGLQHADGSFDEFYPFERGWVGPSAFTMYASAESVMLLHDELPAATLKRAKDAIRRAATFIAAGESEQDHLANHHAMACLAVWSARRLLDDASLEEGFNARWREFLTYHDGEEGWSREYDGVDPGYLSATVSFLGKVYQTRKDPDIFQVLRQSVEFCSYFAYPDGFYAGSLGSRNTLHFYPHGFEILAREIPLASSVARRMREALAEGKLVPPSIMADRYHVYRVPEFLLAALDHDPGAAGLDTPLPYEQPGLRKYFPHARIFVSTTDRCYTVANLAKGGVVKVFDRHSRRLLLGDAGIIGALENGSVVTSQWVDPDYAVSASENDWSVRGSLNKVPSHKLFTPLKHLVFRSALIAFGWIPAFSHRLKGGIRKTLMLGRRPVPVGFKRSFLESADRIVLSDVIRAESGMRISALSVGDDFFVRYVPQSRYFQSQMLETKPYDLAQSAIDRLNRGETVTITQSLGLATAGAEHKVEVDG